jgi:hypothetical protein
MKLFLASFAREEQLLRAVNLVQQHHYQIVDLYTPYPIHGLEHALNWPRSRLPVACFLSGLFGVVFATWFQFWASGTSWPLNVGGRPWNSLPAFVPVIFECMVLLAGFGVVFAFLARCGLYPGKPAALPVAGITDDRFIMVISGPDHDAEENAIRQIMRDCHAINLEERMEEGQP